VRGERAEVKGGEEEDDAADDDEREVIDLNGERGGRCVHAPDAAVIDSSVVRRLLIFPTKTGVLSEVELTIYIIASAARRQRLAPLARCCPCKIIMERNMGFDELRWHMGGPPHQTSLPHRRNCGSSNLGVGFLAPN
jgi:hypothetical protein